MKKRLSFLPNVITAFGLSCGLFVILKMCLIPQAEVTELVVTQAVGVLLLAALADILDGAVARAMRAESDFGGLFDSLADAISFGVAPSVIIMKSIPLDLGDRYLYLLMSGAMIFSICGVLRLIRFNVKANEAKGDEELALAQKKHFTGLPIPGAAAAAIALNLLMLSGDFQELFPIDAFTRLWVLFGMLIVLGYFMISRWKFPSIKTLRIPVASFERVFGIVAGTVLVFYGIVSHFSFVLFIFSWGYVVTAWILSIIRLIAGKKSKTLEDFEPDEDDIELH